MLRNSLLIALPMLALALLLSACNQFSGPTNSTPAMATSSPPDQTVHDFEMVTLDGETVSLNQYKGKVLVLVNVASKCGLTPQYESLQAFYEQYKDKGVVVLGFPANNFGQQEPGTDAEIKEFCTSNYGVTFPMFSKISVKGGDMHPLYQYLTQAKMNGKVDADVQWNFQKFVVDKKGYVVKSFKPMTTVENKEFLALINKLLNA